MKWLCICAAGVVRSGAMAYQLKLIGQDALTAGWMYTSKETFNLLFEWADYIILMQEHFYELVPGIDSYKSKVRVVEVGPDTYGNPLHPGLNSSLQEIVKDWANREFKL